MNFLGHLYFSRNDTDLMAANLLGDFIKGKDLSHYSKQTQKGIFLHRSIDTYIDHHPAVIDLLHILYKPLPKIAGIAVDLYFDHLLAKNWSNYHEMKLEDFIQRFYSSLNMNNPDFTPTFKYMLIKMMEKNWLYQYQYKHGLHKACQGVSGRISFENELVHGVEVFEIYEEPIQRAFQLYMEDAKIHLNSLELL
ncbi:MAG: ACP phosphodiesterase [Bacteroidota bacterium]